MLKTASSLWRTVAPTPWVLKNSFAQTVLLPPDMYIYIYIIAEAIGMALGEFIGSMHESSRTNPDDVLNVFDKNVAAKEASADYYCKLVTSFSSP